MLVSQASDACWPAVGSLSYSHLLSPAIVPLALPQLRRLSKLKDLKGSSVYNAVFDEVNGFRESLPLIASLKNPSMKERHWDKISGMTGEWCLVAGLVAVAAVVLCTSHRMRMWMYACLVLAPLPN